MRDCLMPNNRVVTARVTERSVSDALIHILPEHVIDRIAAGEVVDRPASVVKELIENALDAQAHNVRVEVEGGGRERIVVSDDGVGMSARDVRQAVLRHATSKISCVEDLDELQSLGFRGEALSSIASVAKLTVQSRRASDAVGTRLILDGGVVVAQEPIGMPCGTTIEVAQLFFNVPARRKFLKSPATEQGHILDVAERLALGRLGVGMQVSRSGRLILDVAAETSLSQRVQKILALPAELWPIDHKEGSLRVFGYVGRERRGDASGLYLFVNGRHVRDRLFTRAVLEGAGNSGGGRYPYAAVFLELPPREVDVNVHPQKAEVRFEHTNDVFRTLVAAMAPVAQHLRDDGEIVADVKQLTGSFTYPRAISSTKNVPKSYYPAVADFEKVAGDAAEIWLWPFHLRKEGSDLLLLNVGMLAYRTLLDAWKKFLATNNKGEPLLFPEPFESTMGDVAMKNLATHGLLVERVGPQRCLLCEAPSFLRGFDWKVVGRSLSAMSSSFLPATFLKYILQEEPLSPNEVLEFCETTQPLLLSEYTRVLGVEQLAAFFRDA